MYYNWDYTMYMLHDSVRAVWTIEKLLLSTLFRQMDEHSAFKRSCFIFWLSHLCIRHRYIPYTYIYLYYICLILLQQQLLRTYFVYYVIVLMGVGFCSPFSLLLHNHKSAMYIFPFALFFKNSAWANLLWCRWCEYYWIYSDHTMPDYIHNENIQENNNAFLVHSWNFLKYSHHKKKSILHIWLIIFSFIYYIWACQSQH